MTHITGWTGPDPMPRELRLSDTLRVAGGDLYLADLNLTRLVQAPADLAPNLAGLGSPLEIVYLPLIPQKISHLQAVFAEAIQALHYPGRFIYAYASKANAAEEVVRTVLKTGVPYELSSYVDVEIVFRLLDRGIMPPSRPIICNGFKQTGTVYAQKILELQRRHPHVIPIIEDFTELPFLIDSGLGFDVGLRLKAYGTQTTLAAKDAADSRFGLPSGDVVKAAETIAAAPNLNLRILHAMVGSQITDPADFIARLRPAVEVYTRLKPRFPTLETFNYGGGVPVPMALDFDFDEAGFAHDLLAMIQSVCEKAGVAPPNVMGEMGRYTVAEHGTQLFKVLSVKENASPQPWYIIDGSIMSSFPDTWALTEHFAVLPLTNLGSRFRPVKLGGLTCDSDDIYPPKKSDAVLWLPENTENLHLGFFNIGAYQEMLGGVGGSKHCVIPEATELVVDRAPSGGLTYQVISGQSANAVLENLGYLREKRSEP